MRLTEKDIEVLMFLAQYKMMLGIDCKRIYKGTDYHRKRLKVLEQEGYIRRIRRIYIKLDKKGTKLVKSFGYSYSFMCKRKDYIERIKIIARIAGLTINSNIKFVASWNLKNKEEFTQMSRNYLGKITYKEKESFVYYIAKGKDIVYIRQVIRDIQKTMYDENIMLFMEDMKMLSEKNRFLFGREVTMIIEPTERNLEFIRKLEDVEDYEIAKYIYHKKEILLSNWKMAEYMTEDNEYIIVMPFINTEKLHRLKIFYNDNTNDGRKLTIMTLRDNVDKIEEILENKVNVIDIDKYFDNIENNILDNF